MYIVVYISYIVDYCTVNMTFFFCWETSKTSEFIGILTFLGLSGTEPTVSPRCAYVCYHLLNIYIQKHDIFDLSSTPQNSFQPFFFSSFVLFVASEFIANTAVSKEARFVLPRVLLSGVMLCIYNAVHLSLIVFSF